MQRISRRRLMDVGLGGAGAVLAGAVTGRAFGLSIEPLAGEAEALYRQACRPESDHAAIVEALLAAARARDVAVDEPALRRLLAGTACPLCGCPLTIG